MRLYKMWLLPLLKRFWLMLLSIAIIGALGSGLLLGLRNSYHQLEKGITGFLNDYGYPDMTIQIAGMDERWMPSNLLEVFDEYGVDNILTRQNVNVVFKGPDNEAWTGRVYSYRDENYVPSYNWEKSSLYKGEFLKQYSSKEDTSIGTGLALEKTFADHSGYQVGDEITFILGKNSTWYKTTGEETYSMKIEKIINSPETVSAQQNESYLTTSTDFTCFYLPLDTIRETIGIEHNFNEIVATYKDGCSLTYDEIVEIVKNQDGWKKFNLEAFTTYYETRESSTDIKKFEVVLSTLNALSLLAPLLFFSFMIVTVALFLTQIIKQCRKDIGILRALGQSKKNITITFLILTLVVAIVSSLIGIGFGLFVNHIASQTFVKSVLILPIDESMIWWLPLLVDLIFTCAILITTFFACLSIGKIKPSESMKALPPTNNKTPYLVKTVFNKAPITLKITISQNLRNVRRYLLSGMCIAISGVMIIMSLSVGESIRMMLSQLFDTRLNYDVQCIYDARFKPKTDMQTYIDETFSGDENIESISYIKATAVGFFTLDSNNNPSDEVFVPINALPDDQDLVRVVSTYNNIMDLPSSGLVLPKLTAEKLGVKVGDTLYFNATELHEVTVSAITDTCMAHICYVSLDYYQSAFEGKAPISIYQVVAKVNNPSTFFDDYIYEDSVSHISFNYLIEKEFNTRYLSGVNMAVSMLTAVSILMGFVIVFNMMQIALKEHKRSFATMRTLGYQRRSIRMANFVNDMFQYVLAMIVAIPIGMLLAKTLCDLISSAEQTYPYPAKSIWIIFAMLIGVLAFVVVSHLTAMHDMKKWNLPECIKERE